MLGKKDYVGLTIQDDFIRMAKVRVSGNEIKLIKLDRYSLVEKLKSESKSKQLEAEGASVFDDFEDDEEADSIFGLEEETQEEELEDLDFDALEEDMDAADDDFAADMVEESETSQSNELLLYNLLSSIEDQKIRLGLNIPSGNTIFQVIRDTDFNEVKRKDLIEDLEDKLHSIYGVSPSSDNYSYEIREDGSLFLGSVDDESITLQLLNRSLELFSGKKVIVEDVVPDEVALVGLVRSSYHLEADEITGIIQLGKESCRVVFMKGEEVWLVSPIINEGTEKKSFLNTVFSKILFQLDTGEVPNLDRILLANNTIGVSAVDFFKENFPDIKVENLTLKEELLDTGNVDPSSIPGFTTAIGSALAASGALDEDFPKLSFIPTYVQDRQKIFKLQWHGVAILLLIFLTPIVFNYFYQQNVQKINSLSSELQQINADIRQLDPIVQNTRELEQKIEGLKNKLVLLDDLSENSREWSTKIDILNQGIDGVNNSWITSMGESQDGGVALQGYTLYRNRIPDIVNIFDEATLLGVNNEEMREQRVYSFKISVDKFAPSDLYSPPKPEEVENLLSKK